MGHIIGLTGASHSGKTTTMAAAVEAMPGTRCLHELIRGRDVESIDELRKNPSRYLQLQLDIIQKKVHQENEVLCDGKNEVWLADRSLVDSLFYYSVYVDKSGLSQSELASYFGFMNTLISLIHGRYAAIVLFTPIPPVDGDTMRPKHLKEAQTWEFLMIKILTQGLTPSYNVVETHADRAIPVIQHLRNQILVNPPPKRPHNEILP